ncbi:hypothetical protein FC18_GL001876 [Lacticaseibacillus sharpeae JCM 1186 = DSM 20505]|uniref:Uncharacterized protein n=2 Tax=Lacticaseibacillus sharpeae TaxID=1626 RepID=A0A0R1ZIT6_9LACO|nr:hypothetical protein FC18_GL001876 [Lacticaseibacillus sharpeae JCM 1186 = DSM 20505]
MINMDIEVFNGKKQKKMLNVNSVHDIEKLKQTMGKDGRLHYTVTIDKRSYGVSDVEGTRIKKLLNK